MRTDEGGCWRASASLCVCCSDKESGEKELWGLSSGRTEMVNPSGAAEGRTPEVKRYGNPAASPSDLSFH